MGLGKYPVSAVALSATYGGGLAPFIGDPGATSYTVTLSFTCDGVEQSPQENPLEIRMDFVCDSVTLVQGQGGLQVTRPTGWNQDGSISNIWTPESGL